MEYQLIEKINIDELKVFLRLRVSGDKNEIVARVVVEKLQQTTKREDRFVSGLY